MNTKHVLKASFTEYIRYYKNVMLGLQQACLFLRDLEFELKKLNQKNITDYKYNNPDTNNQYYFLEQDIPIIRKKIDDLLLEYQIMKPEFFFVDEYGDFENFVVSSLKWFNLHEIPKLDFFLSKVTDQEDKKLDILARLLFLTKHNETFETTFDKFIKAYEKNIASFCCPDVDIDSNVSKPILDYLLLLNPSKFFVKNNKLSENFVKNQYIDFFTKLPKVFPSKNNYCVDLEIMFFFFLDLDDYRIRYDVTKLNSKILKVDYLEQFEQMCKRFRSPKSLDKLKKYCCDFLKKNLLTLEELNLNDRFSLYMWEILGMLKDLHSSKLNLHKELFSCYIISCFSSFELSNNKYKFFKKRSNLKKNNTTVTLMYGNQK